MIGAIVNLLAAFILWLYLLAILIPRGRDRFELWLWRRLGGAGIPPGREED